MAGYVVCPACGTRIKAGRERCLRCGADLPAPGSTPVVSWWRSLDISQGTLLMAAAAVSLVVLGGLAYVWESNQVNTDDDVHPAAVQKTSKPRPGAVVLQPAAGGGDAATAAGPALAFEPKAIDASRSGAASYASGNFEAAQRSYEKALAEKPDDPEALNNLGQALVRQNRLAEAVERFDRAIAVAPDKWAYRFNRAHALGQMGQWDSAIQEYRRAADIFPDDYATRFNLAMALHKKGDDPLAVPEFQKAIALAPGEASFHVSLGVSLERMGKVAEAVREYRTYLEMEPAAPDAAQVKSHIEALSSAQAGPGARP